MNNTDRIVDWAETINCIPAVNARVQFFQFKKASEMYCTLVVSAELVRTRIGLCLAGVYMSVTGPATAVKSERERYSICRTNQWEP